MSSPSHLTPSSGAQSPAGIGCDAVGSGTSHEPGRVTCSTDCDPSVAVSTSAKVEALLERVAATPAELTSGGRPASGPPLTCCLRNHAIRAGDSPRGVPPFAHHNGCASSWASSLQSSVVSEWPTCTPLAAPIQKRSASSTPERAPHGVLMLPSYLTSSHTTGLPGPSSGSRQDEG